MSDPLRESVADGTNVLVRASPLDADGDSKCLDFLAASPPSLSNVLIVSYVRTPEEWLTRWRDYVGELPAQLGVIHVGDTMRSAAASAPQPSASERRPPALVEGVASPTNLTGLGIKMSEYLTEWEDNGNRSAVCFDSLTVLLQYAEDVQTAFKFLHTLIGRVRAARARACYKITPSAHDDRTVATLSSLFDGVID
ncbi:DUF7504 family protein [Haladaptatus salinisoli]|uniref:DUF7504 family protein n=1 Tax=Haladaptatus salinisoli TaxID=2884876 RepID=UPI001D0B0EB5|nr:hypothetical protein [Haladaptatus salinisoli]